MEVDGSGIIIAAAAAGMCGCREMEDSEETGKEEEEEG